MAGPQMSVRQACIDIRKVTKNAHDFEHDASAGSSGLFVGRNGQ